MASRKSARQFEALELLVRDAAGPLRYLEAHQRELDHTLGLLRSAEQQIAGTPWERVYPDLLEQAENLVRQREWVASAIDHARWAERFEGLTDRLSEPHVRAATLVFAEQYDRAAGELEHAMPSALVSAVEEAGNAMVSSEEADDPRTPTASQEAQTAEHFAATLDAFIALGLSGRDLALNATVTSWLATVRAVQRASGYRAARRALGAFIWVAIAVTWAGWLVEDAGKSTSEAFTDVMLPVLLAVWFTTGGKSSRD